jgi:predicted nucleic acid-binding protein
MNALDTNVLFYSLDADEVVKQPQAVALIGQLSASSGTVVPWQVACEFLGLLRKRQQQGRMTAEEVEENLADVALMFPLVLPTQRVLERSLDITRRFSLSHWDSLLVAACAEAGVDRLYSEDMDDGAEYDGVAIVNPFSQP